MRLKNALLNQLKVSSSSLKGKSALGQLLPLSYCYPKTSSANFNKYHLAAKVACLTKGY